MDDQDLKELDKIFAEMGGSEKAEEIANSAQELPDGEYLCEIESAIAKNSKNSGKPMYEITLAVEGGKKCWVYLTLAGKDLEGTQKNIARAVTTLKKLGLTGVTIEDYTNALPALVGKQVKCTITTGSTGFVNKSLELV